MQEGRNTEVHEYRERNTGIPAAAAGMCPKPPFLLQQSQAGRRHLVSRQIEEGSRMGPDIVGLYGLPVSTFPSSKLVTFLQFQVALSLTAQAGDVNQS